MLLLSPYAINLQGGKHGFVLKLDLTGQAIRDIVQVVDTIVGREHNFLEQTFKWDPILQKIIVVELEKCCGSYNDVNIMNLSRLMGRNNPIQFHKPSLESNQSTIDLEVVSWGNDGTFSPITN